jgi:ARG and Rhodanese-Phosphatase-superfamily-associated Protein domain
MANTQLLTKIQVGDPIEQNGLTIAPVYPRRQPVAEYVTLDEALPLGFRVTEVDETGAVPELLVDNPLEHDVLLYDGEELVGAKQNRILSATVLVPAHAKTRIPVACVEEGRWSRRSEKFAAAPHAAYPELRRRKALRQSAQPFAAGIAQGEVWAAVSERAAAFEVDSSTGAQSDIYRSRGDELARLRDAFPLAPGQSGALVGLGGQICLDLVSRPDAFARLYPKLLNGYLLDALNRPDSAKALELDRFIADVDAAPRSRRPSVGRGEDVRLKGDGVVGSALELDRELIQLCAFTAMDDARAGRIASPSRRVA